MSTAGAQPLPNTRFQVTIDGIGQTGTMGVVLPQARVVASRGKRPSARYTELILRRGLTVVDDWYAWWDRSRSGKPTPRTVFVALLDGAGAQVVRWAFAGARPVAYSVSSLDALGAEIVVETLELAVRGFDASFGAATVAARTRRGQRRPRGSPPQRGGV